MCTLEQIFTERCINVKAFAQMIGVKAPCLYSILSGKTNPSKIGINTWIKIAHGLGMTADELYNCVFCDGEGEQDA